MNLRLEKRGLQLLSFAFSKYYSSFFFCSASWVILTLIKKNGMSIANPVGMPLLWIQPRWAMCCYQIWKTWMSKISTTHCCLCIDIHVGVVFVNVTQFHQMFCAVWWIKRSKIWFSLWWPFSLPFTLPSIVIAVFRSISIKDSCLYSAAPQFV